MASRLIRINNTVVGIKNFPRYRSVSFRFVHCFTCEISYEISCLRHIHIFIWVREHTRSRTKYRLGFWFRTRYRLGFYEISYETSLGILRDFVRDIAWDFTRFRTRYHLGFCEISYEILFKILRDLVRTFACWIQWTIFRN